MPPQPPAWQLEELRRLYLFCSGGSFIRYRDWVNYLMAMLREYPHLSGSQLNLWASPATSSSSSSSSDPSQSRRPSPEQLRVLHAAHQAARLGVAESLDNYIFILCCLLHAYPYIAASEMDRLRVEEAQTTFTPAPSPSPAPVQASRPTDQQLITLDQAYEATRDGDIGCTDRYLLVLVEMLRQYPNLSATELGNLHSGRADAQRRAESNQPTMQQLRELDQTYEAAKSGERDHENAYILGLVGISRLYPDLSMADIRRLHLGRANAQF